MTKPKLKVLTGRGGCERCGRQDIKNPRRKHRGGYKGGGAWCDGAPLTEVERGGSASPLVQGKAHRRHIGRPLILGAYHDLHTATRWTSGCYVLQHEAVGDAG